MIFPMKTCLCLYYVDRFTSYTKQNAGWGENTMKKVGLSTLTVSVTTHLYCSCSAAKTHSSFIKEGTQGHQLTDL